MGFNHITETAEPKVVKFCTQVSYINSSIRMTYHPQKGRGYGHVTVLNFCHLSWCSASRGFVSDSWATCFPSLFVCLAKKYLFSISAALHHHPPTVSHTLFLSRDAMLARYMLSSCVRLSVCHRTIAQGL